MNALFGSTRFALLSDGALAAVMVFASLFLASHIRRWLELPDVLLFGLSLVVLGAAAEATFFLTMLSTPMATITVRVAAVIGMLLTLVAMRERSFRDELCRADSWAPFAAAAAGGFAFLALFCIALPVAASPVAFAEKWVTWQLPNDNVLPALLASHIAAHVAPKPFIGGWLSSDRPPLQAGFDLLFTALTPFLSDDDARYQALSMLLQASSFGLLFTLCRLCRCSGLRAGGTVLLAWLTGFFLVNTEFVWPKLLAAAFVAVAVAIYLASERLTSGRALATGGAVGLGLLSHPGVVFTLPALVIAVLIVRCRAAMAFLALACSTLAMLYAPWVWYQKVYDPPGDRLLKSFLAGQDAITNQGFGQVLYRAYTDVPLRVIITNKLTNASRLFQTTFDVQARRGSEFFHVGDALGSLAAPFLTALLCVGSIQRPLRTASRLAWISVGSLAFWVLVLYPAGAAIVHGGSYLTMLLMFAAAGVVVTAWPPLYMAFLALQSYDFVTVWLNSVDLSSVVTPSGGFAFFLLAGIGGFCSAAAVRPLLERFTRWGDLGNKWAGPVVKNTTGMRVNAFRAGVFLLIAAALPTAVILARPAALAGQSVRQMRPVAGSVPTLAGMTRRGREAPKSLDAIVVDGKRIIVARLRGGEVFPMNRAGAVVLEGWAFDPVASAPAAGVVIKIGDYEARALYGGPRHDVAALFRNRALTRVGFSATISGAVLKPGLNAVALLVIGHDGRSYYVDPTPVKLNVR